MLPTLTSFLEAHGYAGEDYRILLRVFDDSNQVILINDLVNRRHLEVPVEDDVRAWSSEKLAELVVSELDCALAEDAEEERYG